MIKAELIEYEKEHGTEYAINLLLLTPPDRFEGDYETTLEELERRVKPRTIYGESERGMKDEQSKRTAGKI